MLAILDAPAGNPVTSRISRIVFGTLLLVPGHSVRPIRDGLGCLQASIFMGASVGEDRWGTCIAQGMLGDIFVVEKLVPSYTGLCHPGSVERACARGEFSWV